MAASQSAAADNAVRVLTKEQNLQAEALENRTRKPATNAMAEKAERSSGPRRESPYKGAKSTNRGAGKPYKETRDERDGGKAERSSGPRRESTYKGPKNEAEVPENHTRKRAVNGDQTPEQVVLVAFRRRVKNPGAHPNPGGTGPVDKRNRRDGGPTSRRPFRKGDRNEQYVAPNPENDGLCA
jgi:hypothetical protein